MAAGSVFVPSCERGGAFSSRQCQQGGQCWCVDPTGRELPGTRQQGDAPLCRQWFLSLSLRIVTSLFIDSPLLSSPLHVLISPPPPLSSSGPGPVHCPSQRRLALAQLFTGPIDPLGLQTVSGGPPSFCVPLLQALTDLLPAEVDVASFLSDLMEVLQGLFPSVDGALQALSRSSPRRLQENLFGGKFLKNTVAFNFSGVVGAQGALGLSQLSSQNVVMNLQKNRDKVQSVSRALEDPAFLSVLRQTLSGLSSSQSVTVEQV